MYMEDAALGMGAAFGVSGDGELCQKDGRYGFFEKASDRLFWLMYQIFWRICEKRGEKGLLCQKC